MLSTERDALATLLSTVRAASVEPLSAELLSPACAARCGLGDRGVMLVRLAGNAIGVHHQQSTLAKLTSCEPVSADVWSRLRQSDPADRAVVRISRRPSELGRLWSSAMSIPGLDAHASMARGIVRLRLTSAESAALGAFDAEDRRVIESVPAAWQGTISSARAPAQLISRRLRDAFDPGRVLNRGILGEEAS
jgi:hypothetical protein